MGQLEELLEKVNSLTDEVRKLRSQNPSYSVGDLVLVEALVEAVDEGDDLPYRVSALGATQWVKANVVRGKA